MIVKELTNQVRSAIGDSSIDIPSRFLINATNWALQGLAKTPGLEKLFTDHKQYELDTQGHYKYKINGKFRYVTDILMLNFWSSTGGRPCKLNLCEKTPATFYEKNGIIKLNQPGTPCEFTIEKQDDECWIVFDRPLNIPVIIDTIVCGVPQTVTKLTDEIPMNAIAEDLVIEAMRTYYLQEAEDYSFAQNVSLYLDSKKIPEAIQELHRRMRVEDPYILGEMN